MKTTDKCDVPDFIPKGVEARDATMCAEEGTLLDRCSIVRALHHLPRWSKLPE